MTKNRWTVLVIEDEKNIGNYIETILTRNDYRTLRAADGVTGLSLCTSHRPEVILLDLGLPDMDGMEVLKKIREFSSIPIIVISARVQEREKVEALDGGADDYVTKPFGAEELLARIRTALRHRLHVGQTGLQEPVYSGMA